MEANVKRVVLFVFLALWPVSSKGDPLAADCTDITVTNHVCRLQYGFNPLPGMSYSSPSCTSAASEDEKTAIQNAFDLTRDTSDPSLSPAPKLQADLCQLF